ncbi:F-box/kelch-repeat protein At3g23880-like [Cornus florida]|uniref:F-box/kelch-repeat protein At3g23880-like n=1 Tax=Cornus florida TaxID=4283 RepID=UPI00289EE165|nr:F-box/kelch-repeat protein At3g23880-like [Cornus florida]
MTGNNGDNGMWNDVMTEILSRLPVKSLLRFRCVCNYWYTLIKTSSFITKQHHKNNTRLLVHHYDSKISRHAFGIFPDENLGSTPPVYYNLDEHRIEIDPDSVIGPINGIYCLYDRNEHSMCLWNPAIREFRTISLPRPNLPSYISDPTNNFGFGLDPMTNNYKIIWIRQYWDDNLDGPYDVQTVSVYNLFTNSWRLFEIPMDQSRSVKNSLGNSTYLNGVYYWLVEDYYNHYCILSFDLTNENFHELPTPSQIPKSKCGELNLYCNCIAIILFHPNDIENNIEIWVMKEEGFWTKQLTMGPILDVLVPMGFWDDDGQLLITTMSGHMVLYNIHTLESRDLGHYGLKSAIQVYRFKESLFSLKEGDNSFSMVQA